MTFYGLKTCDTCKKALKALQAAGRSPEVIDVRSDGVADEVIAAWLAKLGPEVLVNTRSTTWRGLDASDRAKAGSQEGALALLSANPTLMKRPVIVDGDEIQVGWTKAAQAAFL